jgi:glycosyltransferase involved in cell wall biosynthesis
MSSTEPVVVVVIGPVPPPVHGAALVTAAVIEQLMSTAASVRVVNTRGGRHRSRVRYHLSRAAAHIKALKTIWNGRHGAHRSVYIAGAGGAGLWYQAALAFFGRSLGYQIFFHHHSFSYLRSRKLAMIVLMLSVGRDACHVTLCEGMSRLLTRRYRSVRHVVTCSNAGVLAPFMVPRLGRRPTARLTKDQPLTVGHLSNLSIEKGLEVVFESLRALRARGIPARLLLAGAPSNSLGAKLVRAAQSEFGDALDYHGPLERGEVDAFLERLDLFLFPSTYRHEAEPLVVLEAARCGVPAVAFDVGCISELIFNRAWLIRKSDSFPEAVVRVVEQLRVTPQREAMRRRIERRFSGQREQSVRAHRQLISLLVGERSVW